MSTTQFKQDDNDVIFVDSKESTVLKTVAKTKTTRTFIYEAIEENAQFERDINEFNKLSLLTERHIEYMVLRDINYFLDIFSGNCEHSWRHNEYKKHSKKIGNMLYEYSALCCFTSEQYTAAVKALQVIFCKKDHRYDDYIVKVLLPEALIRICMKTYNCCKSAAEEYLLNNSLKNQTDACPRGSSIKNMI